MSEFKLLAIRPLNGCDIRFLKNLKEGEIYKFYQNYKFTSKIDGREILPVNENLLEEEIKVDIIEEYIDIYSSNNININISAVVGENGSGKSTLIDFHNIINYYLACYHFKTIDTTIQNTISEIRHILKFVKEYLSELKSFVDITLEDFNVNAKQDEILYNIDYAIDFLKELILRGKIKNDRDQDLINLLVKYGGQANENYGLNCRFSLVNGQLLFNDLNSNIAGKLINLQKTYENELFFNYNLKQNFNFQLFYTKDNNILCIQKIDDKLIVPEDKFFYTILLNYSLHSLNSNHMGNWIFNLFHKNDGYQTPLVINPYREEGIIDINSEAKLSIDRLMFNIIDQLNYNSEALILDKYKFNHFILTKKTKDIDKFSFNELEIDINNQSEIIDYISTQPYKPSLQDQNILDDSFGYLITKFQKIANTYMRHFYNYKDERLANPYTKIENFENWRREKAKKFIKNNNTHITKKFFQTYNFIKNYELYFYKLKFIENWNLNDKIKVSKEEILDWIKLIKSDVIINNTDKNKITTDDIYLNLFPNIFNIDMEFTYNGKNIKLSDMSSGEQQYIFNIHTIIYHINNLKSIKETENDEDSSRLRSYREVNLILDEIELYYHPQFQKNFVKDIVDSIKNIKSLGELKNFNVIFLTHSPFILSDIPSSNIIRLKEGQQHSAGNNNTFGANINDLLANDFFLKNGFVGEFAKNYIIELFEKLHSLVEQKNVLISNQEYIILSKKIQLIGERIIRVRLEDLLNEIPREKTKVDFEIENLSKRLIELKRNR